MLPGNSHDYNILKIETAPFRLHMPLNQKTENEIVVLSKVIDCDFCRSSGRVWIGVSGLY